MAVLKKVKGATLMETLVATVIIVVVFIMASLVLNNVFSGALGDGRKEVETRMKELHYFYGNGKLELPYDEEYNSWRIEVYKEIAHGDNFLEMEAVKVNEEQTITKRYHVIE